MLSLEEQVKAGKLICPVTKEKLQFDQNSQLLISAITGRSYNLLNGKVPLLYVDQNWSEEYIQDSSTMIQEYSSDKLFKQKTFIDRLRKTVNELYAGGVRSKRSLLAFKQMFASQKDNSFCLSIGGGPSRVHPSAVNLNIGPFPNVEVVADAHFLPYADASVDEICCVAVLEHLSEPVQAVREMYRVLKPGGLIFADTPFLQQHHGYPHHYQNFTLTGHRYIFESNGFDILDAGTSLGPFYVIVHFISIMLSEFLPLALAKIAAKIWFLLGTLLVLPLDRWFVNQERAYILASATYVLAKKKDTSGQ